MGQRKNISYTTKYLTSLTTAHHWRYGHSISISACEVWGKEPWFKSIEGNFTHIYIFKLGYSRISILNLKNKTKKPSYLTLFCLVCDKVVFH